MTCHQATRHYTVPCHLLHSTRPPSLEVPYASPSSNAPHITPTWSPPASGNWSLFLPVSGSQILVLLSSSLLSAVMEARLDSMIPWNLQSKSPSKGFMLLGLIFSWLSASFPFLQLQCPCFLRNPLTSRHFQLLTLGRASQFLCPLVRGHLLPVIHLEPPSLSQHASLCSV